MFEATRKTLAPQVLNRAKDYAQFGLSAVPGTDQSKSMLSVPIVSGERLLGDISIENYERENAFGESDVRLVSTVAASLGTALQNARLFDETQRLLKETEQRSAELQVINSIQQGVAAELHFQAIVDVVGDKLREVFSTPDLGIGWYDASSNLDPPPVHVRARQAPPIEASPPKPGGLFETMQRTRQPIVSTR